MNQIKTISCTKSEPTFCQKPSNLYWFVSWFEFWQQVGLTQIWYTKWSFAICQIDIFSEYFTIWQIKTYCSVSWWYFGYFLPAFSSSFFFRFFDSLFGTFSSWSFGSSSSLSVSSSLSSFSESEGSSEGSLTFSGSLEGWVLMKNVLFSSISSLDFSCEFSFSAKSSSLKKI